MTIAVDLGRKATKPTLVTKVFVEQILAVDHNLEYLEFEDPLD